MPTPRTPDLAELIAEMADRTDTGYLFGGLSSGRGRIAAVRGRRQRQHPRATARPAACSRGGLSGVVFGEGVRLVSRVTQGCQPVSRERVITEADGNLLLKLDGEPALDVLLADLQVSLDAPRAGDRRGARHAGRPGRRRQRRRAAAPATSAPTCVVRHIIGLDPTRRGVAIADRPRPACA